MQDHFSTLRDRAFYDNLQNFSYSDQPTFTKLGDMIYTNNRTHPIYFADIPDRPSNQSGYLDPFLDLDRNPRWL